MYHLMGRRLMKDVFGNHIEDWLFRSVHWSLWRTSQESIILEKVFPGLFLGYALYASGIWKGDVLVADLEELETKDAPDIYSKRLNAKEVIFHKEKGEFIFPIRRWTNRPANIHLYTNSRRKSSWFSWRIRGVSSTTSRLTSGCRWSNKRLLVHVRKLHLPPSRGTQSQTVHAKRRIISYSAEVHRRYQNDTYVDGCLVGKANWWLLELWWRSSIVGCMDRFHQVHFVERKATWRMDMVWWETDEETYNLSSWQCMARCVDFFVRCSEKKAKQRWTKNARQLRGIFFIEPNDEEFKLAIRAARRKLEVPMPAAMPCKITIKGSGETHRNIANRKTKNRLCFRCQRMHETKARRSWTLASSNHIYCKRVKFYIHFSLVPKFIPMPQALKNTGCKGSSGKKNGNMRKFPQSSWRKSETRKKWSMKQGMEKGCILVEVAHVKAHRTKNMKRWRNLRGSSPKVMKADGLEKAGAMMDEGFMEEARTDTMKQERERGGVRFPAICGWLPLFGGGELPYSIGYAKSYTKLRGEVVGLAAERACRLSDKSPWAELFFCLSLSNFASVNILDVSGMMAFLSPCGPLYRVKSWKMIGGTYLLYRNLRLRAFRRVEIVLSKSVLHSFFHAIDTRTLVVL